jgi:hypothetical protein
MGALGVCRQTAVAPNGARLTIFLSCTDFDADFEETAPTVCAFKAHGSLTWTPQGSPVA